MLTSTLLIGRVCASASAEPGKKKDAAPRATPAPSVPSKPAPAAADPLAKGSKWKGMLDKQESKVTVTSRGEKNAVLRIDPDGIVWFEVHVDVVQGKKGENLSMTVTRVERHAGGSSKVGTGNTLKLWLTNDGVIEAIGSSHFDFPKEKNRVRSFDGPKADAVEDGGGKKKKKKAWDGRPEAYAISN